MLSCGNKETCLEASRSIRRYETRATQMAFTIVEDKTHRPKDRLKTPTIQFCYGKKINQSHLVRQNIVIVGDPLLEKYQEHVGT